MSHLLVAWVECICVLGKNIHSKGVFSRIFSVAGLFLLVTGCSEIDSVSYFSEWYLGGGGLILRLAPILTFLIAVACVWWRPVRFGPVTPLLAVYIVSNFAVYFCLKKYYQFSYFGEYFYYCLSVFLVLFVLFSCVDLVVRVRVVRGLSWGVFNVFCAYIIVFSVSIFMTYVYRMGAGYCLASGQDLSMSDILISVSKEQLKSYSNNSMIEKNELSPEYIAKNILLPLVDSYKEGNYLEALERYPSVIRYPSGHVRWAWDDPLVRILKGVSFRQISIPFDIGEGEIVYQTYYVSVCGEAQSVRLLTRPVL